MSLICKTDNKSHSLKHFCIQNNLKIRGNACVFRPRSYASNKVRPNKVYMLHHFAFWNFLTLGNSAWDFIGVNFWPRDLFGFCWKTKGFLGFDFCPRSVIPVT